LTTNRRQPEYKNYIYRFNTLRGRCWVKIALTWTTMKGTFQKDSRPLRTLSSFNMAVNNCYFLKENIRISKEVINIIQARPNEHVILTYV